MAYENIDYQVTGRIAVIGLNRAPVNALSLDFVNEIIAALCQARDDDEVRAVIITSALEKAFCAGLDLSVVNGVDGDPDLL